ncbi:MAG: F0F1 ATP synthase subunit B [Proteobacteria bacterium]|nr:F0F1 ATP synthase subunit B [Pseudomonadota bacterium]
MHFEFDAKFWVGIAFISFIALIAKPVGRIIVAGLDKRGNRIQNDLDEAVRLREEAQALLAGYQKNQKKALSEVEEILAHARSEVARVTKETRENLEKELSRKTELAMQKIAQAETSVVQEMRDTLVDMVTQASKNVISANLSKDKAESLLSNSIAEVGRKLH